MPTRILTAAALAASALLTAVPAASAATRYAAPASAVTTGACASASPCALGYAITGAASGDTVVVQSGTHNVTSAITAAQIVHIEGEAGQPRPRIIGGGALIGPTITNQKGGSIKRVLIESTAAFAALSVKEVNISDVIAHAQSSHAVIAKAGAGATIRDSVFHTQAGAPYAALQLIDDQVTGPLNVTNVTAVGPTAGSTGIENAAGGPVTVVNTIARGGTNDITLTAAVQNTRVSYSNYRPLASSGVDAGAGNESTAPVFVDAAGLDFHPASGSTGTIDKGTAGVTLGPDPDGRTRGVPDIGAYEYADAGTPPSGGSGGGDSGGSGSTGTTTTTTTTTGGTTDPGSGDSGDSTATDAPLPPASPPVLGETVGLGPVRGAVTVRVPGSAGPVALEQGASVPVGSVIDATNGTVALTSAQDANGNTQTGEFWGGSFKVVQSSRGDRYTELRLVGALPRCGNDRSRVNAAARRWSRRRLWGRDRGGRFRTRGRNGSATVRGTRWLTEDRCDGTLFKVTEGAIDVRDDRKRKTVRLKRGGTYLAKSR